MQRDELNRIVSAIKDPPLNPADENLVSTTELDNGDTLTISADNDSLLLYVTVVRLGLRASQYPALFEALLAENLSCGQYHNIRLAYDQQTTEVCICYNLPAAGLSPQMLSQTIRIYLASITVLKQAVQERIARAVAAGPQQSGSSGAGSADTGSDAGLSMDINDFLDNAEDDEVLRKAMMNQQVFMMV